MPILTVILVICMLMAYFFGDQNGILLNGLGCIILQLKHIITKICLDTDYEDNAP